MLNTLGLHFGWPGICSKTAGKQNFGKIPLNSALRECKPWAVIHVDCCVPWTVKYHRKVTRQVIKQKIRSLSIREACIGWPEFAIMLNMIFQHAAPELDHAWFCRYPCPDIVIYDNGTEFDGRNFPELLKVTASNVSGLE